MLSRMARGFRYGRLVAAMMAMGLVVVACAEAEDPVADEPDAAEAEDSEAGEPAEAAWEPEGPVTMIVPFSPGGGSDTLGRAIEAGLEEVRPGLTINVEYREGGSGAVGYSYAFEQSGDPHFIVPIEPFRSIIPRIHDVPFDWDDWTSICMIAEDAGVVAAHSDAEWDTVEDLVADAAEAAEAGTPLTLGLPGAGGIHESMALQFASEAGVEFEHVVYDSSGDTNVALMGGDIDISVTNPASSYGEFELGELRMMVSFTEERLEDPVFGDPPTAVEHGWDVTSAAYRGLIMPPDVPQEAADYFIEAMKDFRETEHHDDYVFGLSFVPQFLCGEEWDAYIEEWNEEVLPTLDLD